MGISELSTRTVAAELILGLSTSFHGHFSPPFSVSGTKIIHEHLGQEDFWTCLRSSGECLSVSLTDLA
jgi:hypothetical protein